MTTDQVLALVEEKDFDLMAKASKSPNEGFRALACFREFESAFLARVAKTAVDRKTTGFRTLYKKIDEEDRERQRQRYREIIRQRLSFSWQPLLERIDRILDLVRERWQFPWPVWLGIAVAGVASVVGVSWLLLLLVRLVVSLF
jgi:hypothetical protein